jgi:hypothetical protein
MTALSMILLAGAKHSKSNAERILQWAREEQKPRDHVVAFVQDWKARAFLTADDARDLINQLPA